MLELELEQEETVETVENSAGLPLLLLATVAWVTEFIPRARHEGKPS